MEVSLRVFYPELPVYAELAPARAAYVADAAGRCEVYAWDGAGARQVTDRPQGTVGCAIDPSGERVWWFDDDLAGSGQWRVQPFAGGADEPALPGVPAGRSAGLSTALDGTVAAAVAGDRGTTVHLRDVGGQVRQVLAAPAYRHLVDLAPDGSLLAVGGEPDAPDAVLVIDRAGRRVALLDGTDGQLWAMGFAPDGPPRLLLVREQQDGYQLLLWTPAAGSSALPGGRFDSEIAASWYPGGRQVLVRQDRHARSCLWQVDLDRRDRRRLPTPPGTIRTAGVQPDGDLQYVWTDSGNPPRLRTGSGRRLPGSAPMPVPAVCGELWVPGPGGEVHALLSTPDRPGPHPTVFLLHGGPHKAARDAYDPLVSVFVSAGCAVVRPNYRGSTGYGPAWRGAFDGGVGLTQLDDVAAVHAEVRRAGIARPGQIAVCGESWGGYLALLAVGLQPDLWCGAAAVTPIADCAAAFRAATPAVQALDVGLFGGTPDEVPDRYARSSPLTYVDAVRAPLLLVAATEDRRCPPEQVQAYAEALRRRGREPALTFVRSGHEGYGAAARADLIGAVVTFVCTTLRGRPVAGTAGTR